MLYFENDYCEGAHPAILQKLMETNFEKVPGYGTDPYCASAKEKICAACRCPEADVTFISGGLPRGVDTGYYREIFRTVDPHSLRIADTEGAKLFAALEAGIDLVKPNLEELQETLGREFKDKDDMLAGCYELLDRGAKIVLLSLGKDGAVITDGTRNYYCKSINVAVNSTVGAGDGMVAAAATMLQKGADLPEILRAGVAAGTATVTTFDTISFTKAKYEEIYASLSVTEF